MDGRRASGDYVDFRDIDGRGGHMRRWYTSLCALTRRSSGSLRNSVLGAGGLDDAGMKDSCRRDCSLGSRISSILGTNCREIGDCLGGQVRRLLVSGAVGH